MSQAETEQAESMPRLTVEYEITKHVTRLYSYKATLRRMLNPVTVFIWCIACVWLATMPLNNFGHSGKLPPSAWLVVIVNCITSLAVLVGMYAASIEIQLADQFNEENNRAVRGKIEVYDHFLRAIPMDEMRLVDVYLNSTTALIEKKSRIDLILPDLSVVSFPINEGLQAVETTAIKSEIQRLIRLGQTPPPLRSPSSVERMVRIDYNENDYRAILRVRSSRRKILQSIMLSLGTFIVGGLIDFLINFNLFAVTGNIFVFIPFLYFIFYVSRIPWPRTINRRARVAFQKKRVAESLPMLFTANGFICQFGSIVSRSDWKSVRDIRLIHGLISIDIDSETMFSIPIRIFSSQESADRFYADLIALKNGETLGPEQFAQAPSIWPPPPTLA